MNIDWIEAVSLALIIILAALLGMLVILYSLIRTEVAKKHRKPRLPIVLFQGDVVHQRVKQLGYGRRTSSTNVADVLDAVVSLLRKE